MVETQTKFKCSKTMPCFYQKGWLFEAAGNETSINGRKEIKTWTTDMNVGRRVVKELNTPGMGNVAPVVLVVP